MIKILLLLCIIPWQLSARDDESTAKVYHHVFQTLCKKDIINIYTKDKELANAFYTSKNMVMVSNPLNADIILITSEKDIANFLEQMKSSKVIFFTTKYKLLKKYPNIVGALYWRKGRSQLLFLKERLKKNNIKLPHQYQKFIVDSL